MTFTALAAALLAANPGQFQADPALSSHKAASRAARQQRDDFVRSLPRGATFRSSGRTYQMAGDLRAVPVPASER